MPVLTYDLARRHWNRPRSRCDRNTNGMPLKLDGVSYPNTRLYRHYSEEMNRYFFEVRLHGNKILCVYPDNLWRLFDGGRRSALTKKRLNALSPARVFQSAHNWFIDSGIDFNGRIPFVNGVTVDVLGNPVANQTLNDPPVPSDEPSTQRHCARCTDRASSSYLDSHDGLCSHCYTYMRPRCPICQNNVDRNDLVYAYGIGTSICRTCYDGLTVCAGCGPSRGTRMRTNNVFYGPDDTGHSRPLCHSCYVRNYVDCNDCNHAVRRSEYLDSEGTCRACWDRSGYWRCQRCSSRFQRELTPPVRCEDGRDRCNRCSSAWTREFNRLVQPGKPAHAPYTPRASNIAYALSDEFPRIGNYGMRVNDYLPALGLPRDGLWFGVENEIYVKEPYDCEAKAQETRDLIGRDFCICKSDCSIGRGFELVTVPATLDVHRERWNKLFSATPDGLQSERKPQTGLHIHVSRVDWLSNLIIGKVDSFLNRTNPQRHADLITYIAGRPSVSAAARHPKKVTGQVNDSRYAALNRLPSKTIEFRLFKGLLHAGRLLKAIEFCHAIIMFCREASLGDLESQAFLAWISQAQNRKLYPSLYSYLEGTMPTPCGRKALVTAPESIRRGRARRREPLLTSSVNRAFWAPEPAPITVAVADESL